MLCLDQFLINVLDTPGHVDLVHETAVAASLSEVCFVLVDLMEGVVAQTRTALLHARRFNLHCVLVLNKFDRLFLERNVRQYFDFYLAIEEIITEANKVYSLESDYTMEEEREKYFSMNKNNVIFGSAVDNWMCSVGHFEKYLLDNGFSFTDVSEGDSRPRPLWSLEEYYVSAKLKSVSREKAKGHSQLAIQICFDTIASLYNLESHSVETMLKIYRKIMKDNDKVTPDETLLRRFQIREALPRLRKLLLETWMPLGINSLEIVCGKYTTIEIQLRNPRVELLNNSTVEKEKTNLSVELDENVGIVHIAKIFLVKDMLVGFCKNLSKKPFSKDVQFYLGSSPVEILEYFLMNSTQLIPIEVHLIRPRQIFAVKLSSFAVGELVLPKDSWKLLKDTEIRVDSVLVSQPGERLYRVPMEEDHSQIDGEIQIPIFTASPVFKVIFLKKRLIPERINDEESTAVYNLTFKLLTLCDKMLKVVLKPNGFWELFFLGRLHYEKFLVDFSDTLMTTLKYHREGLSIDETVLEGLAMTLSFERLNIIEQDKGADSSPLLVAFKETITPNYFIFHGRGRRVTFEVGNLLFAPLLIGEDVPVRENESVQLNSEDLQRIMLQNRWILHQMNVPEDVEQLKHLQIIHSFKGCRLWTIKPELDENLLKYLRIGSKMAFEQGGPLCEEPLTGIDLLVNLKGSPSGQEFHFSTSLAITEAIKSFFSNSAQWFRLVVPLYEGHVLISSDTNSYQTVCNEVRRFDGKILDTNNDSGLHFQLPVTESERFIDQIRKKCHGHVDVHFKFQEEEKTNWKRMDFVDEEKYPVESLEKRPLKTKLFEKKEQVVLNEEGEQVEEEGEDVFEILDEDDEDNLNDIIELYDNMSKARVRPLIAQMRRHKGIFEEQNYEMFTGEKQEKF